MSDPTVSVLMTCYNREPFIAEAIESVLASSYADFELIVVDDGSTDRSVEIAREFATKDARVRVCVNEKNLGDYPNRNRAASLAQGKYLKYVDSDDVIYPYGLGFMVQAMEAHPRCMLGIGRASAEPDKPFPIELEAEEAYHAHFLGPGLLDAGPTGCILERGRFLALGGFDELRFSGDESTWLRVAARYPVLLLPGQLAWWRQHQGQEYAMGSANGYRETRFAAKIKALTSAECPLDARDRSAALSTVRRTHSRSLLRLALLEYKPSECVRLMKATGVSAFELIGSGLPARMRSRTR